MTADPLVEGVYRKRLPRAAEALVGEDGVPEDERDRAAQALAACEHIGRYVDRERDRILALLHADGQQVDTTGRPGPRQDHTIRLAVGDVAAADRAAALLEQEGFERWEPWRRGALESFRRTAGEMTVGRTDDVTTVVRIRWAEPRERTRLDRIVRPTAGDWAMVDLPRGAWWAYSLVRPTRLVAERVGLRPRHQDSLGPYLATPDGLIDPLLDVAAVDADDVVMDIGCGDGRLVVGAASRFGCRAVGVEQSASLVDRARQRVRTEKVTDLVRIDHADARSADLSEVTVLFLFLPIDVVEYLLADLLERLPPGARLVVHEQHRLPTSIHPVPNESRAVIGSDSVTVAHRWIAGTTEA